MYIDFIHAKRLVANAYTDNRRTTNTWTRAVYFSIQAISFIRVPIQMHNSCFLFVWILH